MSSSLMWEEEYDCSKEVPITHYKPGSLISLGLKSSQKEGEYINNQNEVVCFDPSVYEKGPACLLIRKDHMQKILKESKLRLVWIIQGEKQILEYERGQKSRLRHPLGGLYHLDTRGTISGNQK